MLLMAGFAMSMWAVKTKNRFDECMRQAEVH